MDWFLPQHSYWLLNSLSLDDTCSPYCFSSQAFVNCFLRNNMPSLNGSAKLCLCRYMTFLPYRISGYLYVLSRWLIPVMSILIFKTGRITSLCEVWAKNRFSIGHPCDIDLTALLNDLQWQAFRSLAKLMFNPFKSIFWSCWFASWSLCFSHSFMTFTTPNVVAILAIEQ